MPRSLIWPTLALLGLMTACQREASAPANGPSRAQAQAEAQTQLHDTPARPGDASASGDAAGRDPDAIALRSLIERAGGQQRARDILVALAPETVFEPDQAELRAEVTAGQLQALAELANRSQGRLQITAHTDPGGDQTAALALAKRRADAVADFLQAHGVAPDRLHTSALDAGTAGTARLEVLLPRPDA